MRLRAVDSVAAVLRQAADKGDNQAETFRAASEAPDVEWDVLKRAAHLLGEGGQKVDLRTITHGSSIVLEQPARREVSPEFRKLLDKRRKAADQAAYDKLVRDVTRTEREAKGATSFLPNAKLQMSQGIHVCVTMGLGYLLGCAMGRLTSFAGASTEQLCGVVGLILALILETALYISRANLTAGLGAKYEPLLDPKRHALKQQKPQPVEGDSFQTVPGQKPEDAEALASCSSAAAEPKKLR